MRAFLTCIFVFTSLSVRAEEIETFTDYLGEPQHEETHMSVNSYRRGSPSDPVCPDARCYNGMAKNIALEANTLKASDSKAPSLDNRTE